MGSCRQQNHRGFSFSPTVEGRERAELLKPQIHLRGPGIPAGSAVPQAHTAPLRGLLSPCEPPPLCRHSRKSLKVLGTVGEPINPEAWLWYYRVVGEERCPIVDTFWQTETVSPHLGGGLGGFSFPGAPGGQRGVWAGLP